MTKLKIFSSILTLALFLVLISTPDIYGAESPVCHSQSEGYCINFAATAVPGLEFLGDAAGLGDLLSRLFTFGMGFVGIAAFIMFMIGGVQYLVAGDKDPTEAKNRMKNAAIGLGVALISWLILFTINPDLVKTLDLKLDTIKDVRPLRLGETVIGNAAEDYLTPEELRRQREVLPPGSQPLAVPRIDTTQPLPTQTFPISQQSNPADPQKVKDCQAAGREVDRAPTGFGGRGCISFCLKIDEKARNATCLD